MLPGPIGVKCKAGEKVALVGTSSGLLLVVCGGVWHQGCGQRPGLGANMDDLALRCSQRCLANFNWWGKTQAHFQTHSFSIGVSEVMMHCVGMI